MSQSTRRLTPAADAQRLFKQSPIDPKSLSAGETDALARELYAVHQEIFGGVTEADFRAYVVDSPAARTRAAVNHLHDSVEHSITTGQSRLFLPLKYVQLIGDRTLRR